MAYDFQKLADVELLEEVPDGASVFVAVDGTVKRVPGSGLGVGGGIATAILRSASESNDSENAVTSGNGLETVPITCDNYTYAQARAILEAGDQFAAMLTVRRNNEHGWASCVQVTFNDNGIVMKFLVYGSEAILGWNANGFFDLTPPDQKP